MLFWVMGYTCNFIAANLNLMQSLRLYKYSSTILYIIRAINVLETVGSQKLVGDRTTSKDSKLLKS